MVSNAVIYKLLLIVDIAIQCIIIFELYIERERKKKIYY